MSFLILKISKRQQNTMLQTRRISNFDVLTRGVNNIIVFVHTHDIETRSDMLVFTDIKLFTQTIQLHYNSYFFVSCVM
jgi:hypothetical protein